MGYVSLLGMFFIFAFTIVLKAIIYPNGIVLIAYHVLGVYEALLDVIGCTLTGFFGILGFYYYCKGNVKFGRKKEVKIYE